MWPHAKLVSKYGINAAQSKLLNSIVQSLSRAANNFSNNQ
jgi:hypothetical protein